MRVLPVERLGLSLDPDPARGLDADEPLLADEPPPEDGEPPPRVTALPPPLPDPADRGVACPSSEYDMPLLKPARCCGACSRDDEPELIDGDEMALPDGELKDEPPPPLLLELPPPPELATLPPPPLEPSLPRSTAPPLLAAPPPVDRSAGAGPLSDGLD